MIRKVKLSELIKCENTEFAISKLKPYDWDIRACEWFLGNKEIHIEKGGHRFSMMSKNIAYENEHGGLTIIDRRRHLTTFLLLCRALYEHLVSQTNIEQSYLEQIGKYIWKHDFNHRFGFLGEQMPVSSRETGPILIEKEFLPIIERDNNILMKLFERKIDLQPQDFTCKYAKNFIFFYDKLFAYKKEKEREWEYLCKYFLQAEISFYLVVRDSKESAESFLIQVDHGLVGTMSADPISHYYLC